MTSSLVGSEMCIRDRYRRWRSEVQSKGQDSDQYNRREMIKAWSSDRRASVSYTHLTLPTICSV
eukprot:1378631-Prorocentrum_lima.AAC.1